VFLCLFLRVIFAQFSDCKGNNIFLDEQKNDFFTKKTTTKIGRLRMKIYCNTLQKWRKKYQNVGQMLPNLMSKTKEKTLTTLFLSH
jgi:hypothetical protein